MSITEQEVIEAIAEALQPEENPEGAVTTQDLVDAMLDEHGGAREVLTRKVRGAIRRQLRAGNMERVQIVRTAIDGRNARVPAYRFVGES